MPQRTRHLYLGHDRIGGAVVRSVGTPRRDERGTPIVLVPGLGAPGYLLRTLEHCARTGPARLLDVPGFRDPGGPACPETLGPLADTVARWLAVVPRTPVVLAGHSTGAQVALHAAVRAPERVRSLVLLSPTFPPRLRRMRPLLGALARTVVHEAPDVVPTVLPSYLEAGPRRLLNCVRSAQADAPEDVLPSVACPVTVVAGERDALCPGDWAGHLAGRAVDGRLLRAPGAHAFPHPHPDVTADALAQARDGRP
ncbi:alpha/beta fold hydrolase [Streptomyces dubilierae]|uniref:Alpha/beta hydrolase n=1 Tax=Streptomyces dubilierae TaxID=3075533 RepID=A0ABU2P2G6_9ACTN|nr:alpha/beta hydrolase [Streptomyces sp. DSM 41921]MDT0386337.1 alpha/beta hydrolase [Streptomyces sp. DSM 41921]